MTAPNPRYSKQILPITRPTIEGQCFFDVNDPLVLQLVEYCYARNAPLYNVELVQLVVLPDAILCSINDLDGNGSAFLTATHSAVVRTLNDQTGHTGPMLLPGPLQIPPILNKDAEVEALAEIAASPTVAIQPRSAGYAGTIISVEAHERTRTVTRPEWLNPKTYPDEAITYRPAKPQLQKSDSWHTIRKRAKKARLKVEAQNRQHRRAAGKRYVGIKSVRATRPGVVHKDRLAPPRDPRYRGTADQVETARKQERHFRREYRVCLLALRAGEPDIVWPAGTNFHHKVNGFPRLTGDWLNPPPPA